MKVRVKRFVGQVEYFEFEAPSRNKAKRLVAKMNSKQLDPGDFGGELVDIKEVETDHWQLLDGTFDVDESLEMGDSSVNAEE